MFPIAHAQSSVPPNLPAVTPNKPSAKQTEAAIAALLTCAADDNEAEGYEALDSLMRYLEATYQHDNRGEVQLPGGPYRAFETTFAEISLAPSWGGIDVVGWTVDSNVSKLATGLKARGFKFEPATGEVATRLGVDSQIAIKITQTRKTSLYLVTGKRAVGLRGEGVSTPGGNSLICTHTRPTEAEVDSVYGSPSVNEVARFARGEQPRDKAWVESVFANGRIALLKALASYPNLEPNQVERLLVSPNADIAQTLIANANIVFSASQIDRLISANQLGVLDALIFSRFDQLSSEQRARLRALPATRIDATLRGGDALALAMLRQMLMTQDETSQNGTLEKLVWAQSISSEMVDVILELGKPRLRGQLAMNSKFNYSPAQVEKMLTDPEGDVVVGILRRKEIKITRAQFDRGINSAPTDILFWYNQNTEHIPSTEQREAMLTDADDPTRRGVALDRSLTLAQKQRARKDRENRATFIGRDDVVLTEADFDSCTSDPDIEVRFACVRRADYRLTQARFETIVSDKNGNVLRFFLESKGAAKPNLDPFIRAALVSAKPSVLIAIASNDDINLSVEQLAIGAKSPNDQVRAAFCGRPSSGCVPALKAKACEKSGCGEKNKSPENPR